MEQTAGVQGDADARVGGEDTGGGFAGKVSGDGFYGDYKGYRANKEAGYRPDASDVASYQNL